LASSKAKEILLEPGQAAKVAIKNAALALGVSFIGISPAAEFENVDYVLLLPSAGSGQTPLVTATHRFEQPEVISAA
jgi:hypothetical protein